MNVGHISWVSLEQVNRYSHRFCETPRHRGQFRRSVRVVVFIGAPGTQEDGTDHVLGVCRGALTNSMP